MGDSGFDPDDFGSSSPPLEVGVHSTPPARTPPTPSPVPPPGTRKPPKYVKANLTKEEEERIKIHGIRKGGKTKKRKSKSRRRRNGRTYRRS